MPYVRMLLRGVRVVGTTPGTHLSSHHAPKAAAAPPAASNLSYISNIRLRGPYVGLV